MESQSASWEHQPWYKARPSHLLTETCGLPEGKHLNFSKKDALAFGAYIKAREGDFGNIVTKIPIALDETGAPLKFANLVPQHSMIKLTGVKHKAHARFTNKLGVNDAIWPPPYKASDIDPANNIFHNEIFYLRMNLQIVATSIKNCLSVLG